MTVNERALVGESDSNFETTSLLELFWKSGGSGEVFERIEKFEPV